MSSAERKLRVTFISTVHPHPWAPTKGAFNRTMLEGLTRYAEVRAIVPVPWTERLHPRQAPPATSYPVVPAVFRYVPVLDRLALARRMSRDLAKSLAAEPLPDVILSYWTDPDGTAALGWGRRIQRPVVQIAGGSDVLLLTDDPARRDRIATTLHGADMVLAIGEGVRRAVIGLGVPEARVHVVSRGVDRDRFKPGPQREARASLGLPHDVPLLLWVGRMVPVKGLDVLLAALGDPRLKHSNVRLALVGDGPLRRRLERQVQRLGLDGRVTFVGAVGHADLPAWYAAADLVVLPSRSEGVPNVLLEGLACGRPFVASNVGGVAELTTKPEMLLPVGDVAAWTTRILHWLDSPGPSEQLPEVDDHHASALRLAGLLRRAATDAREACGSTP